MGIKVIITGATGMVGEGVLLSCLNDDRVDQVLIVTRKHVDLTHPKLKELLVPDFLKLDNASGQLSGYDACFYCAGISSLGMDEPKYTHITYDTTMHFARIVAEANPGMVFNFVSGAHTDGGENGKIMWARVKGRTENALKTLPFKRVYNFRPGGMSEVPGQKNGKLLYRMIISVMSLFMAKQILSLREVATAMINAVVKGYSSQTLEIKDIKALSKA